MNNWAVWTLPVTHALYDSWLPRKENPMMEQTVTIYTDGGCWPNPGHGGWGAVLIFDRGRRIEKISGYVADATNNRMELTAVIRALQSLTTPHNVVLNVDSKYVKRGYTEWLPKWIQYGWKTVHCKPVSNQDLWNELQKAAKLHEISWYHVPGHAGNVYNEMADQLATDAREAWRGLSNETVINA